MIALYQVVQYGAALDPRTPGTGRSSSGGCCVEGAVVGVVRNLLLFDSAPSREEGAKENLSQPNQKGRPWPQLSPLKTAGDRMHRQGSKGPQCRGREPARGHTARGCGAGFEPSLFETEPRLLPSSLRLLLATLFPTLGHKCGQKQDLGVITKQIWLQIPAPPCPDLVPLGPVLI